MGIEWIGPTRSTGSYILHLDIQDQIETRIGALGVKVFRPGDYCYIGSAQGKYASSLPYRLLRHCITSEKESKSVFHDLSTELTSLGLVSQKYLPKKKLHWHIDYLLEQPVVDIVDILIITKEQWNEIHLVDLLERMGYEQPVRDMGSTDTGAYSHFLKLIPDAWQTIKEAICSDE